MKRSIFLLLAMVWVLTNTIAPAAYADEYADTIATFKSFDAVTPFFENAYGYAVFPTIGKGGFIVGGAFGTGKVYHDGKVTGVAKMMKGSIGFQVGGQAFSQLIFFQDKRAYDEFVNGSFEFDAGVSAVAVTAGAQARAGTDGQSAGASAGPNSGTQTPASYRKGMAVFVHSIGGFMLEAAVGGQKFTFTPISR